MRILFVYSLRNQLTLKRPLESLADIHIGISYISAYLRSRKHSTHVVVLSSETPSRSLALLDTAVAEFDPQLVAFTAVSTQYSFISAAARHLRQRWPKKPLILGGVHASLRPDEVIQDAFDVVCVGEGELPMAELAEQIESGQPPCGISNLWIKRADGKIEKNPTRSFLTDLDRLPFPDREMWHDWVMQRRRTRQVVLPSRGCPYNCSYCSNHALRKLADGDYVRLRSPVNILQEIRELKQRYPEMRDVYLQSETIAVNIGWLDELATQIKGFNDQLDQRISFACNFRIARPFLNDEVFSTLERANVRTIEIGLESGSERIRSTVRRHHSNEDFYQAVALARRHGMNVNVYNMIGLPGETPADHRETIEVNRRVCPNISFTSIFFPYPGTDLFETCKARGLITKNVDVTAERCRAMLDYPEFHRAEIQRAFDWFEYRVYRGHRPVHFRLRKVLRNKISSHAWSQIVFMRLLPFWHALSSKKQVT